MSDKNKGSGHYAQDGYKPGVAVPKPATQQGNRPAPTQTTTPKK